MTAKSREEFVKQVGEMSVLDLSKLIKELEEAFGVSAAMPVTTASAPVAAASAAPAAEEKAEYKVTLKESGAQKIETIKVLKAVAGMSLSAAKAAADNPPAVIAESASKDDANKIKKELEAVGAKVELS